MIQNWSIRTRATQCAHSERAFEEGEVFHTAIYFDPETNGYVRRDVALDVWKQEVAERKPIAYWRATYSPNVVEAKPEVTSKESAMALLQRFIEEDDPMTENARYILALMLERKRILSPTATKEVDGNKMLFYENKKTGEVFIVRDPDLLLSELAELQDEVAMLLGFGGPGAEAAKAVGMKFGPDGKLIKADEKAPEAPPAEGEAGEQPANESSESTKEPTPDEEAEAALNTDSEAGDEAESAESSDEDEKVEASDELAEAGDETSDDSAEADEEFEALTEEPADETEEIEVPIEDLEESEKLDKQLAESADESAESSEEDKDKESTPQSPS